MKLLTSKRHYSNEHNKAQEHTWRVGEVTQYTDGVVIFYNEHNAAATPTTVFLDYMDRGGIEKVEALVEIGKLTHTAHQVIATAQAQQNSACSIL